MLWTHTYHRFRWLWAGIILLLVTTVAHAAYSHDRQLTSSWRGIVTGLLLLLYLGWIYFGLFHRLPMRNRGLTFRLLAWFAALTIGVALVLFNHEFAILLWILAGSTPFYLGKRLGVVPMIGVFALIGLIQAGGLTLPRDDTQWGSFAGWLAGAAIWVLLILAVQRLVRERDANERLIADLKASQEQLRQAAAQERELVVLRERERLARDLHDIIGHALVLASVKLEAVQRLAAVDRERAAAELTTTQQLLRQTMTELRQAVANLRTVPTDRQVLAAEITNHVQAIVEQTGSRADLRCEPISGLSLTQDEALRRTAQETLTNIVKHAEAASIAVSLRRHEQASVLEITDDGRGFAADGAAAAGHFGLRGMQERMELAGGTLAVTSAPGAGTRIRATIPTTAAGASTPEQERETVRGAA